MGGDKREVKEFRALYSVSHQDKSQIGWISRGQISLNLLVIEGFLSPTDAKLLDY